MEEYYCDIIYAINNGFIIGNHSYSHPHFSNIDFDQAIKEVTKTDSIINDLYNEAGVKRPAKLFRFPYGDKGNDKDEGHDSDKKSQIQCLLKDLDYKQPKQFALINNNPEHSANDIDCYWTFDTAEWAIYDQRHMYGIDSPEKVYLRMKNNDFGAQNLILFHDHEETTDIFISIIEEYINMGLQFSMPALDNCI